MRMYHQRRRFTRSAVVALLTLVSVSWLTVRSASAVQFQPQFSKSFASPRIHVGDTTKLTFAIYNPEPNNPLTAVSFTDPLPAGLVVASTPNIATSPSPACGGTLIAVAGSSSVSLSAGTVPDGGFLCSYSVDVTGTAVGVKHNVTSPLSASTTDPDGIDPGDPAVADLTVAPACTTTITGVRNSVLVVSSGNTCVTAATINASVSVQPGASIEIEKSTINGTISANGPAGFRMCASSVGGSVTVRGATGPVVIGDPSNGCGANTISGSLALQNNTGGVIAKDNTVAGAITASGNTTQDISGNHH
jgi:uncharacterized repeat protein (TIGR01451 family)